MAKKIVPHDIRGQMYLPLRPQEQKKPLDAFAIARQHTDFWNHKYTIAGLFDKLREKKRFLKTRLKGRLPYAQWQRFERARREAVFLKNALKKEGFSKAEIEKALRKRTTRKSRVDAEIAERIKKFESKSEENKWLVGMARQNVKELFVNSKDKSFLNRQILLELTKLRILKTGIEKKNV